MLSAIPTGVYGQWDGLCLDGYPPGYYMQWNADSQTCGAVASCTREADSNCSPNMCFPYHAMYCSFAGGQYIGVVNDIPWCYCHITNGCSPAVIDYCHSFGRDIYASSCLCTPECWWVLQMDCAFNGGMMNTDCECVAPGQGGGLCNFNSPCGDNAGACYEDISGNKYYCYPPHCISINQISYFEIFCGGFFNNSIQRWCEPYPNCQ